MEGLFKHLDVQKKGFISKEDLLEAIRKLRNEEISPLHELRIPNAEDLDMILTSSMVEENSQINYDEYLVALYKVTLENFGE
jgi:hypothetical protein